LVDYQSTVEAHEDRFLPDVLAGDASDEAVIEFDDAASEEEADASATPEDE